MDDSQHPPLVVVASKTESPTHAQPEGQTIGDVQLVPSLEATQVSVSQLSCFFRYSKPLKDQPTFTVAEDDEFFDGDSAYGAFSDVTDTVSLSSSIMRFREENGRTYHAYGR